MSCVSVGRLPPCLLRQKRHQSHQRSVQAPLFPGDRCVRLRAAKPRANAGIFAASADPPETEQPLTKAQREERLTKAVLLLKFGHELIPRDKSTFSFPWQLWKTIAEVHPEDRVQFCKRLDGEDLENLWNLAGTRYEEPGTQNLLAQGPYSVWDDLPNEKGQIVSFQGKPGMPLENLFGFRKSFFLNARSDEVFGRTQLQKGPLIDSLYPLYFKVSVAVATIPGTEMLTDVQLEYLEPDQTDLGLASIPKGWPPVKKLRKPFDGGLIDYCRMLGPGVMVGVGWKKPEEGMAVGYPTLPFLLVRRYD